MARFRRPSDPATRARDATEGMKIIVIILTVWSFGFLWLTTAGYMPYISGNYTNTVCCNLANFCMLVLAIGVTLRFRKEEGMKRRITEILSEKGSVAVKDIAGEFVMNPQSVAKVMYDWARENPRKGTFDAKTGVIERIGEDHSGK